MESVRAYQSVGGLLLESKRNTMESIGVYESVGGIQ